MNNLEEYAEEYYYKKYPVTLNIGEEGRKQRKLIWQISNSSQVRCKNDG